MKTEHFAIILKNPTNGFIKQTKLTQLHDNAPAQWLHPNARKRTLGFKILSIHVL